MFGAPRQWQWLIGTLTRLVLWRFVAFHTQAADERILKPVGGGFQFRHRELRRFLAERYGAAWLHHPSRQSEIP